MNIVSSLHVHHAKCIWRQLLILMLSFSLCTLFLLLHPHTVHAQTEAVAIFLPKQYEKPKGSPVTYTDTFEAGYADGSYSLWVQSGENGSNEVKNASVALNGVEIVTSGDLRANNPTTKIISLQPVNTMAVTLKGKGDNHLTVKVFCNGCPPVQVQIDSPFEGATITSPYSTVSGALSSNMETGVVVNGVVAQVAGNQFIADHVPVTQGDNTITATATTSYGGKASASITVYGQPPAQYINLLSTASSGLSPLEVTLKTDTFLTNSIASASLIHTGPSDPAITSTSTTEYKALMASPGLYTFTLVLTDSQGHSFEDTLGINVFSREEVDLLLKEKWTNMKGALLNQDIGRGTALYTTLSRNLYEEIFTTLHDQLPQLISDMQDIQLISVEDGFAKYRIRKKEFYGGQMMDVMYYIYFVLDENGIWKIAKF